MKIDKTVTKTVCDVLQKEIGTKELKVEDTTIDISHKAATMVLQKMIDEGYYSSYISPAIDAVVKENMDEKE